MYSDSKGKRFLASLKYVIFKPDVDLVNLETEIFEELNRALVYSLLSSLLVILVLRGGFWSQLELVSEYVKHVARVIWLQ